MPDSIKTQEDVVVWRRNINRFNHYVINKDFLFKMLTQSKKDKAKNFGYYTSLISHWKTLEPGMEHFYITLGRSGTPELEDSFPEFYEKMVGNDTLTFSFCEECTRVSGTGNGMIISFGVFDKNGYEVNFINFAIIRDRITGVHMGDYP